MTSRGPFQPQPFCDSVGGSPLPACTLLHRDSSKVTKFASTFLFPTRSKAEGWKRMSSSLLPGIVVTRVSFPVPQPLAALGELNLRVKQMTHNGFVLLERLCFSRLTDLWFTGHPYLSETAFSPSRQSSRHLIPVGHWH